jgi:hypothetical protein
MNLLLLRKMLRYLIVLLLFVPLASNGQDNSVNVLSAQGFAGGHLTYSKVEKNSTQWLQRPGFGANAGAGFQWRFGRGLMVDLEGGYELSYFVYKHTDLRLSLGYQCPYGALRLSHMFSIKESKFRYWYASASAAYMFTGAASLTDGEFDYTYTIQLAPGGVMWLAPEIGLLNFLGDNNTMSYGITFRYAWKNTITNTMQKLPELNPAVATSNANYIGFIVRYHHPVKVFKRKNPKGDNDLNGRIKI